MKNDTEELTYDLDLGHDHFLQFYKWAPDRKLNPQYKDLPDVPKAGAIIQHRKKDGSLCFGSVQFDLPELPEQTGAKWKVESWDPLTISPSVYVSWKSAETTDSSDKGSGNLPRYKPYTVIGIRRVPCARCGRPSAQQWQICSLGRAFHGLCTECDIKLNELVLTFIRFQGRRRILLAYRRKLVE